MYTVSFVAFEKKAAGESRRILDRDGQGVFQRGQLQLADGHHRRAQHVADQQAQKNGKRVLKKISPTHMSRIYTQTITVCRRPTVPATHWFCVLGLNFRNYTIKTVRTTVRPSNRTRTVIAQRGRGTRVSKPCYRACKTIIQSSREIEFGLRERFEMAYVRR